MSLHRYANPGTVLRFLIRLQPWLGGAALIMLAVGLYFALFASPADYQQGESVRIMYVHVPAAWVSLLAYGVLAGASAAFLIWKHPVADVVASQAAPLGAAFTLVCLITGSLWGKPMWGAWWVWDARLTSVLVLFFLYIGYMALESSVEEGEKGRKACAILALVGFTNIPVIRFSVEWWNTLHQPASLLRMGGSALHPDIARPLLLMGAAYALLFLYLLALRTRAALLTLKHRRRTA